jgi:hypothetical protein
MYSRPHHMPHTEPSSSPDVPRRGPERLCAKLRGGSDPGSLPAGIEKVPVANTGRTRSPHPPRRGSMSSILLICRSTTLGRVALPEHASSGASACPLAALVVPGTVDSALALAGKCPQDRVSCSKASSSIRVLVSRSVDCSAILISPSCYAAPSTSPFRTVLPLRGRRSVRRSPALVRRAEVDLPDVAVGATSPQSTSPL